MATTSQRASTAWFERDASVHLNALYGAALRLTRSPSDAEDLVQETLLRAFRFRDKFQEGTNFRAWLFKIQRNTFINQYRRSQRERDVLDGEMGAPIGDGVMSRAAMRALTAPVDQAHRRIVAEEIQVALDRLSDDAKMMVLLADVEGLAYKEIADVVGVPIGTVMSRLHRARKVLQTHLISQAVELGIVEEEGSVAETVELEAYRRRKGGGT